MKKLILIVNQFLSKLERSSEILFGSDGGGSNPRPFGYEKKALISNMM